MKLSGGVAFGILVVAATGCAPAVYDIRPTQYNNQDAFDLYAIYGSLDGTQEEARQALTKAAAKPCPDGHTVVRETDLPRTTRWGSPNGQVDLTWTVVCK